MRKTILSPAKVNLYLDVLSKREDGYHDIVSVMQAVSLYDEISIDINASDTIEICLNGSDNSISWDESNLVHKACRLFVEKAGIVGYKFDIFVKKSIPIGAGMAGGSTDAAGTLLLLNKAFREPFSTEELCSLGAKLGADVAFCINAKTALCEGIGERLTPLSAFSNKYMVCAIDESSVSTPKAYALLDEKYGTACGASSDVNKLLKHLKNDDLNGVCDSLFNKFESVIIPTNPKIEDIKKILTNNGALGALMSGSGPSVFGIFEDEKSQKRAIEALKAEKIRAFLCKSL